MRDRYACAEREKRGADVRFKITAIGKSECWTFRPQSPVSGGLSEVEAARRLKTEGYNELPQQNRRTPLRVVLEVLREPMLALLLGAGSSISCWETEGSVDPAGLCDHVGSHHGRSGDADQAGAGSSALPAPAL